MIVTVQEYGKSQGGSPKVKANGVWYFLNKDCQQPPLGPVDIKVGSFQMGNPPKSFATIEDWRPAGGNGQTQHNGASPSPAAPPAGDYTDEATMRFASNCVGSAITSGVIMEPGQILAWYQAALKATKGQPAPIPFDDRVP